jgi:hypothetical protein
VSYSAKFIPERYEPIAKVLDSIKALRPGGFVTTAGGREELSRVKYLVYDFLSHTGLKSQFKLKMLEGELLIQRKADLREVSLSIKDNGALIESLIELWGTTEAKAALESWIKEERISEEEGAELWESVSKIMT